MRQNQNAIANYKRYIEECKRQGLRQSSTLVNTISTENINGIYTKSDSKPSSVINDERNNKNIEDIVMIEEAKNEESMVDEDDEELIA